MVERTVAVYHCHDLSFHDSFMYRTSIDRICDIDVITVLHPIGGGLEAGPSCGLGQFQKISKKEVDTLRKELRAK